MDRASFSSLALVAILTLGALAGAARAATPEEREQARQHYESATRKYDTGRFEDAAAEFQQVFDLIGDPALLFNIAQSYRLAQKPDKALLFYRSYLRRAPDAASRVEVEKRIAELTEILKRQPPPPEPTPREAPPPARLDAPPVPAAAAATTPPPQSREPAPHAERRALRIAGLTLSAVGLAGLVVGAAMTGVGAAAANDLTHAASQHAEFTPALRDAESRLALAQPLSIAGWVVGGAAAVAGVALVVAGRHRPERAVRVGLHATGVSLAGRF